MIAEGHTFPERHFTVDPVRVEEFVAATGVEPEPGWSSRPGTAVPLGFLTYIATYGPEEVHTALGLDMLRTLFAGTRTKHCAPVRVGDELTLRAHVSKIADKETRRGRSLRIEVTVDYVDQRGEVVVREQSTVIQRG